MTKTFQQKALETGEIAEIKRALTDNNYSVALAAAVLSIPSKRLSARLNGKNDLAEWWWKKKREKKKKNARDRQRRSRERREQRREAESGAGPDPRFEQW